MNRHLTAATLGALLSAALAGGCGSSGSGTPSGTSGSAGASTGGSSGASGASGNAGSAGRAGSSGAAGGGGSGGAGGSAGASGSAGAAGAGGTPDGWPMQWLKIIGGPELDGFEDVAATPAGNFVLAGGVSSGTDFGGGPVSAQYRDLAVAELTPAGAYVWHESWPGTNHERGVAIAATASALAVVAKQPPSGPTYLRRLSASGADVWNKTYSPNGGFELAHVALDGSGNVFVTAFGNYANFGSGTLPQHGQFDAFVAGLDAAQGNELWAESWGNAARDLGGAVATDPGGALYACGTIVGAYDFGTGSLGQSGGTHVYVVRRDPSGTVTWAKSFFVANNADDTLCTDAAVAPNGDVLFVGTFTQAIDFEGTQYTAEGIAEDSFVLRMTSGGQIASAWQVGGSGPQVIESIAVSSSGRIAIAGTHGGITLGSETFTGGGMFIAELDAAGAVKRAKRFDPLPFSTWEAEHLGGLAFLPSGTLIVVGGMGGPVIVEGVGYYDIGKGDGFILALSP